MFIRNIDGVTEQLDHAEYLSRYKHGCIRIQRHEYPNIPTNGFLTHFNLSPVYHKPGQLYYLPRIIDRIQYGSTSQPVLSFEDIYVGLCTECVEEVDYNNLPGDIFEHSMTHISNTDELRQAMVNRYVPTTGESESVIANLPVAITKLRIVSLDTYKKGSRA